MIVTRTKYNLYLRNSLIGQSLYLFTFLLTIFLLILVANIIAVGGPLQTLEGTS